MRSVRPLVSGTLQGFLWREGNVFGVLSQRVPRFALELGPLMRFMNISDVQRAFDEAVFKAIDADGEVLPGPDLNSVVIVTFGGSGGGGRCILREPREHLKPTYHRHRNSFNLKQKK